MTIVQVKRVHGGAGVLAPAGTVDVLPLVSMIDGFVDPKSGQMGHSIPHAIVYGLQYFRLQGGTNAVILDPAIGDIGMAILSDRDISSVVQNKGQANPGSQRRFDLADGVYVGGILNGTPTQYVQFTATGINIVDRNGNSIQMGVSGINFFTSVGQVSIL